MDLGAARSGPALLASGDAGHQLPNMGYGNWLVVVVAVVVVVAQLPNMATGEMQHQLPCCLIWQLVWCC